MLALAIFILMVGSEVRAQSLQKALVWKPSVLSLPGRKVSMFCEVPQSSKNNNYPLTLCTWESIPIRGSKTDERQLLSFTSANTQPVQGYESESLELAQGRCPLHIASVKDADFANWQCTLFSSNGKNYRGNVDLKKSLSQGVVTFEPIPQKQGIFSEISEIKIESDKNGGHVSEVKVESPGLLVKKPSKT